MKHTAYILVSEFCRYHHIEVGFIEKLQSYGVIEISRQSDGDSLSEEEISHLEKMVRLHQELAIHPEDLDVVSDLINRLEAMQSEMEQIKERLQFFEQHFEDF